MSSPGRLATINRVMAVLDTAEAAVAAAGALERAGFASGDVLVLSGERDAELIDILVNAGGAWARARRLL